MLNLHSLLWLVVVFIGLGCKTAKPAETTSLPSQNEYRLNVINFGAIPNDGRDDTRSIQDAINTAVRSGGVSIVYLPPGIYDIEKGLVISNQTSEGEYFFVSLEITGHIPAFSSNPAIGASTVLRGKGVGFTLALQHARQCAIKNLVFEGPTLSFNTAEQILSTDPAKWKKEGDLRINQYSPNCAIAIDPFHASVQSSDQYPGFATQYRNKGSGGSSMIMISECSFTNYYISIANNPADGTSNGDNIRVENSHVSSCHTFWACGQTQSRANSISNVYALFINTFVSNGLIGKQHGTPPTIDNVNIAGFCKMVFNVTTAFSGIGVRHSYLESIWSLGIAMVNTISFDQCQIQFAVPSTSVPVPPFHLYSNCSVNLNSCSLEYFNNCQAVIPFMFRSEGINMIGGSIEGGVLLADGITNEGGEKLHNVNYSFTRLKCNNSYVSQQLSGIHLPNLQNKVVIGGTEINTYDGQSLISTNSTYDVYKIENVQLNRNDDRTITFLSSKPYLYKIGDNLLNDQWYNLDSYGLLHSRIRGVMGYVSAIAGSKITVSGVPEYVQTSGAGIYFVGFPVFQGNLEGKTSKGSNIIQTTAATARQYVTGDRIQSKFFERGTYVVKVETNIITMSSKALNSTDGINVISDAGLIHKK